MPLFNFSLPEFKSIFVQQAQENNILKYDIFGVLKQETTASAKDGQPFAVTAAMKTSAILRVWNNNGQIGVTTTSDLSSNSLSIAMRMASEAAEFGLQENAPQFSPLSEVPMDTNNISFEQKKIESNSSSSGVEKNETMALIDAIVAGEKYILSFNAVFKSVPYNKVAETSLLRFYLNSNNSQRIEKQTSSHCYFYPLAQIEGKKVRQAGHVSLAKDFSTLNVQSCAQSAIQKTEKHLNYCAIPTGKYNVVFAPEAFLQLIGAFENFFNAQNVFDKKSLATLETIGKTVAAPLFNIADDPLHVAHIGASTFDEEGTPTRKTPLIENGVLVGFLQSSGTAKRMNVVPTGHARLGAKVGIGSYFYHIMRSPHMITHEKDPWQDQELIYIDNLNSLHAGVNSLQGSFSLPFDGWWMRNGTAVSIEAATVAGDFLSILKNIHYMGRDNIVTPSGISPEVWIGGLAITGAD